MSTLVDLTKQIQTSVGVIADGDFGINSARAVALKFKLDSSGSLYNVVKKIQYYVGVKVDGAYGLNTANGIVKYLASPNIVRPEPKPLPDAIFAQFDERSEKILKSLDPRAVAQFRGFLTEAKLLAASKGYEYKMISGNRSYAEQNALYAQGRTSPGKVVTNAKGGQSNHNFGIAVDCGVFKDGKYVDGDSPGTAEKIHKLIARALVEKYELEWGGDWKSIVDTPHFEIDTGFTMARKRELMAKYGTVLV